VVPRPARPDAPPEDLEWEPVKIGPTWQWDDGWVLPEATLGWGFLSWTGYWLNGRGGKPWTWTPEQTRFLLWYYAVDSAGDFAVPHGRLQRLKGWGKDPLRPASRRLAARADRVRPLGGRPPDRA
jgi:hypothetical protein